MKKISLKKLSYADKTNNSKFRLSDFHSHLLILLFFSLIFNSSFYLSAAAQTQSNEIYYKQGLENLNRQDFAAAVFSFQAALKISPDDDKSRHGLAIALIGVEKFAEASREIAKLLVKKPKDENLLEMAAQSFWNQKRYAEAEIVLRRRLSLGNERAQLWALYGDALDAQKKTAEATSAYEKAVRLMPDSIDLRYALGALLWKLIRYEEAEREFLEILKRQPNEPRASFNLGDIYLTNGEAAKSLPFLETAARAFPEEFDTRFALGRALTATNKFEQAIAELQAAVKINPVVAEGHYQLGLALQRAGRREEAKIAFKKAQDLQNAKRAAEAVPEKKKP